MFSKIIDVSPLVGGVADSVFPRIYGDTYNSDVSFLATLRALVAPRLQEGEQVYLRFTRSSYHKGVFEQNRPTRVIYALYPEDSFSDGSIVIHNVSGGSEDTENVFEGIEKYFLERNTEADGWMRLEKVTEFFHRSFKTLCYVNPEHKRVVVFVDNLNFRRLHFIQVAIFAFLPWYFDPQKGVTADEMELIQSLRERTEDKYIACIEKIAGKYDFRTMGIQTMLKGFETRYERIERDRVKAEIEEVYRTIERYDDSIRDLLAQKEEYEIRLLGLDAKIISMEEGGDSEIMEYFLCNKKLSLANVDDHTITFACQDYLMYFDEDMARSMINNDRSYVYIIDGRRFNNYIPAEDMKLLMNAIFIDQELRIKFCAAYRFELSRGVTALSGWGYGYEFRECMPNPHTDRYSCMGNYQREITMRIKENDYIGAIEQSIASCKSLNFGDSTVMAEFMRRMYGVDGYDHNKCIELPDGRVVDPLEAIKYLKEKDEQKEEQEETNE